MSENILVITVGGSCEPIINAIKEREYDKIFFVCSTGGEKGSDRTVDGPGRPCKKNQNDENGQLSIVEQAGLAPETYEKFTLGQAEIDDLSSCYQRLTELAGRIEKDLPDAKVVANFTGGTKTMSACLVTAAIVFDWELNLNVAPRDDLRKVRSGDIIVRLQADSLLADRYRSLVYRALEDFNYAMAASIAEQFIKRISDPELRYSWQSLYKLVSGFSLWDAFSYKEALEMLEGQGKIVGKFLGGLRELASSERPERGYAVVADLLHNADRRAARSRFDDAVSRLYRATELLAQTRLKVGYGLESGELTLKDLETRLPGEFVGVYRDRMDDDGRIRLGLHETYRLLVRMDDMLGKHFMENENRVLDVLKERNNSFLAHGLDPVAQAAFEKVSNVLSGFISAGLKIAAPRFRDRGQLPRTELLDILKLL